MSEEKISVRYCILGHEIRFSGMCPSRCPKCNGRINLSQPAMTLQEAEAARAARAARRPAEAGQGSAGPAPRPAGEPPAAPRPIGEVPAPAGGTPARVEIPPQPGPARPLRRFGGAAPGDPVPPRPLGGTAGPALFDHPVPSPFENSAPAPVSTSPHQGGGQIFTAPAPRPMPPAPGQTPAPAPFETPTPRPAPPHQNAGQPFETPAPAPFDSPAPRPAPPAPGPVWGRRPVNGFGGRRPVGFGAAPAPAPEPKAAEPAFALCYCGARIAVPPGGGWLGREGLAAEWLEGNRLISRRHVFVSPDKNGRLIVRDDQSLNGVWYDTGTGRQKLGKAESILLKNGDMLWLYNLPLKLEVT